MRFPGLRIFATCEISQVAHSCKISPTPLFIFFLPLHLPATFRFLYAINFSRFLSLRGHTFWPKVRHSSPPSASSSNPHSVVATAADPVSTTAAAVDPISTAATAMPAPASSHPPGSAASVPMRYNTRVSLAPPSLPHPRPSWRAPPSKRARTSGPGESSSSRPPKPQSLPTQGPAGDLPLDLSPASIIRKPYFHYGPIPGNVDYNGRDLHNEVHYDLLAFTEDLEFRDAMCLV